MIKKLSLIGAAAAMGAATLVPATPAVAQRYYDGYYDQRYDRGFDRRSDWRGDRGWRADRVYRGDDRFYRGDRCRDGSTGTIVGAIAGGLLGNTLVGRRGDGTMGAIVGGAAGALAGRAIDKRGNPRFCR